MRSALLAAAVVFCSSAAYGFSFTTSSDPSECDDFTVTWSGGTAPYTLLLSPVFGTPRNISIPTSASSSYTTTLPFEKDKRFIATMSDSTSFASGGTTDILTVGASKGGSCNATMPNVDFTYELNDGLNQCRAYTFSGYDGAVQPVTIMGIIPGGQSIVLSPPVGPRYLWTANVLSGTSMIFVMTDSRGRAGGSSDVKIVGATDDSSCINSSSPSSTTSASPSSTSGGSSTSSSGPSASSDSKSSTPIGAIAGTVLGGLIFLAVTITLGLFFLRRRKERQGGYNGTTPNFRIDSDVDLGRHGSTSSRPYHYPAGAGYNNNTPGASPFLAQSPYPFNSDSSHSDPFSTPARSRANSGNAMEPPFSDGPFNPYEQDPYHQDAQGSTVQPFTARHSNQPSMSASQRKAAMAGVSGYVPSRFVVHTDLEDAVPPANEDGVVELPPQYSERRGAPSSTVSTNLSTNTSSLSPSQSASQQQQHHHHYGGS